MSPKFLGGGIVESGIFETDAGGITVGFDSRKSYASSQIFILNVLRDLVELLKDGVAPLSANYSRVLLRKSPLRTPEPPQRSP